MDVPPEEQIPSTVRTRNMPAIKHDDIVVRNSRVCGCVQVCVCVLCSVYMYAGVRACVCAYISSSWYVYTTKVTVLKIIQIVLLPYYHTQNYTLLSNIVTL